MQPTDEQMAGFLIVRARSWRGLSQRAFAERVGITQPVLSRYESGRQQPTLPVLLRVVHGAGLELRMELTEPPPRTEWEIEVAQTRARMERGLGWGALGDPVTPAE